MEYIESPREWIESPCSFTFLYIFWEVMGMPVMISHANDGTNLSFSGNTTCKSL